jgi:hypothetical protein
VNPETRVAVEQLRAAIATERLYIHVKREDAQALMDAIAPDTFGLVGMDAVLAAVRKVVEMGREQRRWVPVGAAVIYQDGYDHESPDAKWADALSALEWALQYVDA